MLSTSKKTQVTQLRPNCSNALRGASLFRRPERATQPLGSMVAFQCVDSLLSAMLGGIALIILAFRPFCKVRFRTQCVQNRLTAGTNPVRLPDSFDSTSALDLVSLPLPSSPAYAGSSAAVTCSKVKCPSRASTRTRSPSQNSPWSRRSANGSCTCRWMTRFSGRAP